MANTTMSVAEQIKAQREQSEQQQRQLQQAWVNDVAKEEDPDVRSRKMTNEFEMVFGRKAAVSDMDWLQKVVADERSPRDPVVPIQTRKFFVPEGSHRVNETINFGDKGYTGETTQVQTLSKNTPIGNLSGSITKGTNKSGELNNLGFHERLVANRIETKNTYHIPIADVGVDYDPSTGKVAGSATVGDVIQIKKLGTAVVPAVTADTDGNVTTSVLVNQQANENLDVYANGSRNWTNGTNTAGGGANFWVDVNSKWKFGIGPQYTRVMGNGADDNVYMVNLMAQFNNAPSSNQDRASIPEKPAYVIEMEKHEADKATQLAQGNKPSPQNQSSLEPPPSQVIANPANQHANNLVDKRQQNGFPMPLKEVDPEYRAARAKFDHLPLAKQEEFINKLAENGLHKLERKYGEGTATIEQTTKWTMENLGLIPETNKQTMLAQHSNELQATP